MAEISIKEIDNSQIWEKFVLSYNKSNFLHSWYWGEFNKKINNKIYRFGLYKNHSLVGVCLCIIQKARRATYAIVPGGPLINWDEIKLVEICFEELKKFAIENKCCYIRIRPQLYADDKSKQLFKNLGFINAPMHLHAELTLQINLDKDEKELLHNMRKNTRYEIKKAMKQNIEVTATSDPDDIRAFYETQCKTAKRQGFIPFSYNFLFEQFKIFSSLNKAYLYKATISNQLITYAFVLHYNDEAIYHYAASTELSRKYAGAYLIQWQIMKDAKKRGIKIYNLWGLAPKNNSKHRFWGVSVFKRGFGGKEIEYLHAQDYILNKPRYFISYLIEIIRKKTRNL